MCRFVAHDCCAWLLSVDVLSLFFCVIFLYRYNPLGDSYSLVLFIFCDLASQEALFTCLFIAKFPFSAFEPSLRPLWSRVLVSCVRMSAKALQRLQPCTLGRWLPVLCFSLRLPFSSLSLSLSLALSFALSGLFLSFFFLP